MRTILIIILLLAIVLPCSAELTQQDLEKIGNLMDRKLEPIKIDIATMKVELKVVKEELKAMQEELKTLDSKVNALDSKVSGLENKMATKDDIINLTGRMDTLYGVLIGILVAIIVAILTIIFTPDLKKWLGRREQIKDEKRFQIIEAEIEAIKKSEEKRKEAARRIAEEKPEFAEAYRMLGLL